MLGGGSGIMRAQVVFITPSIFSELFVIHYGILFQIHLLA